MTSESEFRAYPYIIQVLQELGWDTKNPRRGGSVYTQGEFRKHDTILDDALGLSAPENIVLIPWDGGYPLLDSRGKGGAQGFGQSRARSKAVRGKYKQNGWWLG